MREHAFLTNAEKRRYEYLKKTAKRNPRTNAGRIRAMTDEELSELLVCQERCPDGARRWSSNDCYALKRHGSCENCWLDWLREEVAE